MNEQQDPLNFADLENFCAVAQYRSFRLAAEKRDSSPSALSHSLRRLEASLGVRLLNRTTRSVTPTDAGSELLTTLAPAFQDIRQALADLRAHSTKVTGHLRLNAPRSLAVHVVSPLINALTKQHPDLQITLVTDDSLVNIVEQGFDAGFRFGESLEQDMLAVPVRRAIRFNVVASPAYLERFGTPEHPGQLLEHACIGLRFPNGKAYAWEFSDQGRPFSVNIKGPLQVDATNLAINSACEGVGLAYVFEHDCQALIEQNRLVPVLQAWMPPAERLYLYHPSRRQMTPAMSALIELIQTQAETNDLSHRHRGQS
ncbi:LysR family transcriptional regulator [Hydrogenophaga sp. 5NK40-0174]|uniref:LysR family transcriptional regulator n=1 Tax=Hydrogenophaga sp. 5NK40-0174 TaxID=3127649 RepID=UPI0031096B95